MIEVELHDGRILEFPDGTDNAVIDRVAKQETMGEQPAPEAPQRRSGIQEGVKDFASSAVEGFRSRAAGLGATVAQGLSALGVDTSTEQNALALANAERQNKLHKMQETSPYVSKTLGITASGAGEFAGDTAPFLAAPAGAATMAGRAGLSAAGAAAEAITRPDSNLSLGQKAGNAAVNAAIGGAMVPAVEGAAKGIGLAGKAIGNAVGVDKLAAKELSDQGIDVSRATAGSDLSKSYVRRFLATSLFGANNIKVAAERVENQIENVFSENLKTLGVAEDSFTTGQNIRVSIDKAKDAFKTEAARLYDAAESAVNKDVPASAKNVLELIPLDRELTSLFNDSKAVQSVRGVASEADDLLVSVVKAVDQDSRAGTLSVGALMQMRRDVGSKLADIPFVDARQGALKRLYGAITEDLRSALAKQAPTASAGAGDALRAFNEANAFYRKNLAEMKTLERRFGGARSEEQMFNAVTGATRLDTKRLNLLLDKMSPGARKNLQASVLRRLAIKQGSGNMEEVSVGTFANNYEKLSPQAKDALFRDPAAGASPTTRQDFEKLIRNWRRVEPLVKSIPENGMQVGMTGTDAATLVGSIGGALVTPAALIAGIVKFGGDKVLSAVLTKPRTLKAVSVALEKNTPQATNAAVRAIDASAKTSQKNLTPAVAVSAATGASFSMVSSEDANAGEFNDYAKYAKKVIQIESGGKADAKAKKGNALGAAQFTEDTWLRMFSKLHPDKAKEWSRERILKERLNPEMSERMAVELAKDNGRILAKLGIPVNENTLYLAHFAGIPVMNRMKGAKPEDPVEKFFSSDQVARNKSVLQGKTVREFFDWVKNKVQKASEATQAPTQSPAESPKPMPAVKEARPVEKPVEKPKEEKEPVQQTPKAKKRNRLTYREAKERRGSK